MTTQLGHLSLSRDASAWFAAMSDPRQHELARPARMPAPELPVVIEAASDDGVLPIVARNLHRLTAGDHRAIMIEGATAQQFNKIRGNELQQDLVALAGRNLLLLHHANRI